MVSRLQWDFIQVYIIEHTSKGVNLARYGTSRICTKNLFNMAKASRSHSVSSTRVAIRNFTSQWLLIPQGTGILAVIMHNLDYQFRGLGIISEIFWVLTIVLLILFLFLYVLRICLYPRIVAKTLATDITEIAGLASISITLTAIINCLYIPHDGH